MDVILFRGPANNSYYAVYFNALPEDSAENVEVESRAINLQTERHITLHVEIYNPNDTIPLIMTAVGNGDTSGFGNLARIVAAITGPVRWEKTAR